MCEFKILFTRSIMMMMGGRHLRNVVFVILQILREMKRG